jgi:aspartate racemase
MKKIGIIGGLSPESTLYYYKKFIEISRQRFEPYFFPELMIYSINFHEFMNNAWEGRKEILIKAAKSLEKAGAQIIAISANTPHKVFPDVAKSVNVPMLSIIDAIANEAKKQEINKLLLLGTKTTMSEPFYKEALRGKGFEVFVPGEEEMDKVHSIIFDEIIAGKILESSKLFLIKLIEKYRNEKGIEGVILGCTELPLIIKAGDVSVKVLDSAEIHVKALIEKSMKD